MRLLGEPENLFGRMELIEYEGLSGEDRFSRAHPPATGILRCGYMVDSIDDFITTADEHGVRIEFSIEVDAIFGAGRVVELTSPAGLRIEVMQARD
jgi:catechol 2,3-dioxygenase-like lactoylglutathione lyase family enzyme